METEQRAIRPIPISSERSSLRGAGQQSGQAGQSGQPGQPGTAAGGGGASTTAGGMGYEGTSPHHLPPIRTLMMSGQHSGPPPPPHGLHGPAAAAARDGSMAMTTPMPMPMAGMPPKGNLAGPNGPYAHDLIPHHQESHMRSSMSDPYRPHPPSHQHGQVARPQGVGELQRQMADLNARSRPASPGLGPEYPLSGTTPPNRLPGQLGHDYPRQEYASDHYHSMNTFAGRRGPGSMGPIPPQGFDGRPPFPDSEYRTLPRYVSPPDHHQGPPHFVNAPGYGARPMAPAYGPGGPGGPGGLGGPAGPGYGYGKPVYTPHHISPLTSSTMNPPSSGGSSHASRGKPIHPMPVVGRTGDIRRGELSAPGSSFASPTMSEDEEEEELSDEEYPHPSRVGRGHGHGHGGPDRNSGKRSRVGSPTRGSALSLPIKDEEDTRSLAQSAPTSPPKAVNRLLRRRTNHNVVERRRRDGINHLIYEICDLIPRDRFYATGAHSPLDENKDLKPPPNSVIVDGVARPNKAHVLRECVGYVKELHESIRVLRMHAPPEVAQSIASPPANDIVFFQSAPVGHPGSGLGGAGGGAVYPRDGEDARHPAWRSEPQSGHTTPYTSNPASPSLGPHYHGQSSSWNHPSMMMTALSNQGLGAPGASKTNAPAAALGEKTSVRDSSDVAHLRQELQSSLGEHSGSGSGGHE